MYTIRHTLHSSNVGFDEMLMVVCIVATGFDFAFGLTVAAFDFASGLSFCAFNLLSFTSCSWFPSRRLDRVTRLAVSSSLSLSSLSASASSPSGEGRLCRRRSLLGSRILLTIGGDEGGVSISFSESDRGSEGSVAELERQGLK